MTKGQVSSIAEDIPMPLLTVEGIYKDGMVQLSERPPHLDESARVLETFLSAADSTQESLHDPSHDPKATK
jgi:hypothetical protein